MTTRQMLLDLGRCLRAAAAPLLTLGVLTLARPVRGEAPSPAGVDELFLVAWRTAVFATLLWLLVAVVWAAIRPWRDRCAYQRLQHLRELAAQPSRVLVFVQTIALGTAAGQHAVVINVATGTTHRAWLSETTVPIGAFVVLERTNGGVGVVDWMDAHQVESGHRHERRHAAHHITSGRLGVDLTERDDRDDARQLIEEAEQFLLEQDPRR